MKTEKVKRLQQEVYRIVYNVTLANYLNEHKYTREQCKRKATIYTVQNVVRVWKDGIVKISL